MKTVWTALKLFIGMSILTGILYPLLITLFAQIALPTKSNGSMVKVLDKTVGSSLIAQKFTRDEYFWGRPSANDYNPLASGGSNLGPTSAALKKAVAERKALLSKNATEGQQEIPSELLYASGSGLDPHISPAAAYFQMNRVAQARHIDPQKIKELVDQYTQSRRLGIFGERCINVFLLNLALDDLAKK